MLKSVWYDRPMNHDRSGKNVIVIATHRSGIPFFENLLQSFKGYNRYPILAVIAEYRPEDLKVFSDVIQKHPELPITLETLASNSFEFGALYTAYQKTNYEEFFLLSHSCEILKPELFEIIFEKHQGKSTALSIFTGNWEAAWQRLSPQQKRWASRLIDPIVWRKLEKLKTIRFWQGHIGKYRRAVLSRLQLEAYLPHDILEAVVKSEFLFTPAYHAADPDTVVLFPDWNDDRAGFYEKFGRERMKIENEYIVKWKTHWTLPMVIEAVMLRRPFWERMQGMDWSHWFKTLFPRLYSVLSGNKHGST